MKEFNAQPLPDDHPLVDKLNNVFGDHTFLLGAEGLHIVERTGTARSNPDTAAVVKVASWEDASRTRLQARRARTDRCRCRARSRRSAPCEVARGRAFGSAVVRPNDGEASWPFLLSTNCFNVPQKTVQAPLKAATGRAGAQAHRRCAHRVACGITKAGGTPGDVDHLTMRSARASWVSDGNKLASRGVA